MPSDLIDELVKEEVMSVFTSNDCEDVIPFLLTRFEKFSKDGIDVFSTTSSSK